MTKKYYTAKIKDYRAEMSDRDVVVTAKITYKDPDSDNIHEVYTAASATCHPNDIFDFATGVALATLRLEKRVNDLVFRLNEALY